MYIYIIIFFIFIVYICRNNSKFNGGLIYRKGIFYKVIRNNSNLELIYTRRTINYNGKHWTDF